MTPRWTPEQYRQKPTDPDPGLCVQIIERVSNGELLVEICREREMPLPATFLRWVSLDPTLEAGYREALSIQTDVHADEIMLVTQGTDAQTARVQLDALKFRVERMNPTKYGPRAVIDLGRKDKDSAGGVDHGYQVRRKLEQMAERMAAARTEPPAAATKS